jgi:hypothetical protein
MSICQIFLTLFLCFLFLKVFESIIGWISYLEVSIRIGNYENPKPLNLFNTSTNITEVSLPYLFA